MNESFPVLKRLGPVPLWRGEEHCLSEFEVMYRKARDYALRALAKENARKAAEEK